jgi:hypothetical protein
MLALALIFLSIVVCIVSAYDRPVFDWIFSAPVDLALSFQFRIIPQFLDPMDHYHKLCPRSVFQVYSLQLDALWYTESTLVQLAKHWLRK